MTNGAGNKKRARTQNNHKFGAVNFLLKRKKKEGKSRGIVSLRAALTGKKAMIDDVGRSGGVSGVRAEVARNQLMDGGKFF
jgi:hypothetical protein